MKSTFFISVLAFSVSAVTADPSTSSSHLSARGDSHSLDKRTLNINWGSLNPLCWLGKCPDYKSDCNNCGWAGNKCWVEYGTPACNNGQCGIASCNPGYVHQGDKCVQQTWNDCDNCGWQGNKCTVENGTPACNNGQCGIASCNPGYVHQGGKCVPNQPEPQPQPPKDCLSIHGFGWDWDPLGLFCRDCRTDTNNCGKCGVTCKVPYATKSVCILGKCKALSCAAGYSLSSGGCSKRWAKMHKRRLNLD